VFPGKRPISNRPAEVELRQRIGHWEGDTVIGSDMHHCVLTLVARKSGYAIVKKRKARTMHAVTHAASRAIRSHCRNFKTPTFDNVLNASRYSLRGNSDPGRAAGADRRRETVNAPTIQWSSAVVQGSLA
jgi:IS30 family transposase